MTTTEFTSLQRDDLVRAAKSGKTYRVVVSQPNSVYAPGLLGHYVYVQRCNEQGTQDGLTNREKACGSPIREASAKWVVVNR